MDIIPDNTEHITGKKGWIEVISGSMFSGKTEELIRRLKRAQIARLKVKIFKPNTDTRFSKEDIVSHDANVIRSVPVTNSAEILTFVVGIDVVGIDEAQFFDNGIVEVVNALANNGIRVIIAGLDMDYLGIPFGPMPLLLACAEYITKVHAICMKCGNPAQYSRRLSANKNLFELGERDKYEPLCRQCYHKNL